MADVVMGAMGNLIPKLGNLLKEEYNLQAGMKERIDKLTLELKGAEAALRKVAQVPWDQLDEQVKLWAREVRESSYDMEDILDTYLVHVQGCDSAKQKGLLERLGKKMANLFKKSKARREISLGVKDIMTHLDEVTERSRRYKVDDIVVRPATMSMVDPRLAAMYNKVKNLVGIDNPSGELISMLQAQHRGDMHNSTKIKIVSVVGVGGLGKTTLAKAVYDKLKGDFDHRAFVPVGRNPDLKKVIKMILIGLDKERYMQFNFAQYDELHQFIDELREFLLEKESNRYFIVVDDIWEVDSWETIKKAIDDDNNCGGRIIVTTRNLEVARYAGEVYKLQPLSGDSARELFYTRMSGDQGGRVDNQPDEISDTILKKCGGIPLAIITMASLLVAKPKDKWSEIYKTIGFGHKDSKEAENTMRILSFSYYDLPSHLRTCLLYLSVFPEDSFIEKDALIWKWIAEGFVHVEEGMWLFETGEGYFNDLINRSLIEAVEDDDVFDGTIIICRVHDIVLDFIRSMSREENFLTILDSDQDTPLQSHVRRLAQHNRTIRHGHHANHLDDMRTVRSFSAQGCAIESWAPLSCFTLLRVLAIEYCSLTDGSRINIKHVGHLLHLRYLSLQGTSIHRVPEEIGGLRFLQTLDFTGSDILETPWSSCLPTQLVCLRITFDDDATTGAEVGWVERLTSLEELLIATNFQWKELGSLSKLRVLTAALSKEDEESERDFVESVSRFDKLQHLTIVDLVDNSRTTWKVAGLVLPRQLRHLAVCRMKFLKLPSCINPSGLPNLAHLDLTLEDVDEQDLENLAGLPELRFLKLVLRRCSAAISDVNNGNNAAVYFPKLRCFKVPNSMVLFLVNKEDKKKISFHLLDGWRDIAWPSVASDEDNREDSTSGKGTAAAARFMPNLQELHFRVDGKPAWDHGYMDNLGWDYLSSLREIKIHLWNRNEAGKVKAALRRAANEHPNRPALHIV